MGLSSEEQLVVVNICRGRAINKVRACSSEIVLDAVLGKITHTIDMIAFDFAVIKNV